MPAPKGMRTVSFSINDTDAVHVYSEASKIWLQLRRNHPTAADIGITSFKTALKLTPLQAIAIAGELLTAAAQQTHKVSVVGEGREVKTPLPVKAAPVAKKAAKTAKKTAVPVKKAASPAQKAAFELANHGNSWTPEEDKKLINRFTSKLPLEEIARKHKRGIGAVQARLTKLGKLAGSPAAEILLAQTSSLVTVPAAGIEDGAAVA